MNPSAETADGEERLPVKKIEKNMMKKVKHSVVIHIDR